MIEVKEISLDDRRGKKKFFRFIIDLYKGNQYAAPNFYFDEFDFGPSGRGDSGVGIRHFDVRGRLYPAAALRHLRLLAACSGL